MSIRLLTALGLALVVGNANAQRMLVDEEPIELVAHCTFEQDGVAALGMLCGSGARKEVEALFLDHARAHGWCADFRGPDFIDFGRAATCPAWVLDQMAVINGTACGWDNVRIEGAIAVMLARNGRVNDALHVLSAAIEDVKLGLRHQVTPGHNDFARAAMRAKWDDADDTSRLSEYAAKIAARAGQWERALSFAKDWTPTAHCANCEPNELRRIRILQARCLVALGRYDGAIALARKASRSPGWNGRPDPKMIALWIEGLVSTRRARDGREALDAILSEAPKKFEEECRQGLVAWQVMHMRREEQLMHLEQVAQFDPDRALELLLSSGSLAISARMNAFDVLDGKLREPELTKALAKTGHPDVGAALQATIKGALSMPYYLDVWTEANAQWNALAVVR